VVAVLLWAVVGRGHRWPAVLLALGGALLSLLLLMPWILYADLGSLYTSGAAAFWQPGWLLAVAGGALLTGDPAVSAIAGGAVAGGRGRCRHSGGLGLSRRPTGGDRRRWVCTVVGALEAAPGGRSRASQGGRWWPPSSRWCCGQLRRGPAGAAGLPGEYSDLLARHAGRRVAVLLFGPFEDLRDQSRFEGPATRC
jgi:hypothetical protein